MNIKIWGEIVMRIDWRDFVFSFANKCWNNQMKRIFKFENLERSKVNMEL